MFHLFWNQEKELSFFRKGDIFLDNFVRPFIYQFRKK